MALVVVHVFTSCVASIKVTARSSSSIGIIYNLYNYKIITINGESFKMASHIPMLTVVVLVMICVTDPVYGELYPSILQTCKLLLF